MFVSLGLRHLCVTDSYNRVVGVVTRKDLDRAAGRVRLLCGTKICGCAHQRPVAGMVAQDAHGAAAQAGRRDAGGGVVPLGDEPEQSGTEPDRGWGGGERHGALYGV